MPWLQSRNVTHTPWLESAHQKVHFITYQVSQDTLKNPGFIFRLDESCKSVLFPTRRRLDRAYSQTVQSDLEDIFILVLHDSDFSPAKKSSLHCWNCLRRHIWLSYSRNGMVTARRMAFQFSRLKENDSCCNFECVFWSRCTSDQIHIFRLHHISRKTRAAEHWYLRRLFCNKRYFINQKGRPRDITL